MNAALLTMASTASLVLDGGSANPVEAMREDHRSSGHVTEDVEETIVQAGIDLESSGHTTEDAVLTGDFIIRGIDPDLIKIALQRGALKDLEAFLYSHSPYSRHKGQQAFTSSSTLSSTDIDTLEKILKKFKKWTDSDILTPNEYFLLLMCLGRPLWESYGCEARILEVYDEYRRICAGSVSCSICTTAFSPKAS